MSSASIVALLLVGFVGSALMGLVAFLIAAHSPLAASTAFAWGAVLGPIGVVTVIVVVTKAKKSLPPSLSQEMATW